MANLVSSDLTTCAQFLTKILQADNKDKRNSQRKAGQQKLGVNQEQRGCIVKRKYRKSKLDVSLHRVNRPCMKVDSDISLEEDIQRIIEIKRKLMQAPTLNEHVGRIHETPERDRVSESSGTPYNCRLKTSTPQRSPVRIIGSAEFSTADGRQIQDAIDEHAMNSYEFMRDANPKPQHVGPMLIQGDVQFQPHPNKETKVGEQRLAFDQQVHDAMQNVYIDSLKASMQVQQSQQPQYSMYSDSTDSASDKPCRDTSSIPAKELRAPISPFKYNKSGKQPNLAGSLPLSFDQKKPSHELDKHVHKDDQREGFNILPTHSKPTDISQLSRAQLLQAALKVALESGALDGLPAFMKSGPISPFKPGTKGFSAYETNHKVDQQLEHVQKSQDDSTLVGEGDFRAKHQDGSIQATKSAGYYYEPPLRDSVAELHIPDAPVRTKSVRKAQTKDVPNETTAVKKTKNKKTQFSVGAKKKTEINGKAKKIAKPGCKGRTARHETQIIASQTNGAKITNAKKTESKNGSIGSRSSHDMNSSDKQKKMASSENTQNLTAGKTKEPSQSIVRKGEVSSGGNTSEQTTEKKAALCDTELADTDDNSLEEFVVPVLDQAKYNSLFVQIKHLTKELKNVPGIKLDREGKRLLKELDEKVNKGKLDLQTDLDIAVQPVRSHNAQLRRRLRIMTQQLKEKERELQNAEKPDPNFMVVHLQIQNYNLDNELKATKQVITQLKEEVNVYQKELEVVKSEKNELLQVVGKPETSSLEMFRENQSLKTQISSYKQSHNDVEQEKREIENKMQVLDLTCKQKDQELANMQNLVHTLQGSMKKLLEEMRKAKTGAPEFTVPENILPAPTIFSDRNRQKFVHKGGDEQPPKPSQQSFPSNTEAIPQYRFETIQEDSRSISTQNEREDRLVSIEAESAGHPDTKDDKPAICTSALPSSFASERVGMYLFDQPGLNYSKIAESMEMAASKRRSLSTNPDTDITEYKPYPGMSPISQSAFDKLDPFVKDLVRSQRLKKQEANKAQTDSPSREPALLPPGSVFTATSSAVTLTESETKESTSTGPTVKELLTPLADRMQRIQTLSDNTERSRAIRAINFDSDEPPQISSVDDNSKPHMMHVIPPLPLEGLQRPSIDISDDSFTKELKKDIEQLQYEDSSTLLTSEASEDHSDPAKPTNVTAGNEGDSRYSVTDYFQKYPDAVSKSMMNSPSKKRLSICDEEGSHDKENSADFYEKNKKNDGWANLGISRGKVSSSDRDAMIGRWAEQVVAPPYETPTTLDSSSNDILSSPQSEISPQVKLYLGTDLDTSLSTINDRESVLTEITSNSVTTTGSLSSVDDRIFRQGLANLDANIERVQKSLREAMFK